MENAITSNVIYEFKCPNCSVSYVGMTTRHLCTRVNEHRNNSGKQATIKVHTESCINRSPTFDDFRILKKCERDMTYLSVTEALFIREAQNTNKAV